MTDNFLPNFTPPSTHGPNRTLQCEIRNKAVRATPEERVRQRILHWLIHDKKWPRDQLHLERSYDWVSDPDRTRIRPDIELSVNDNVTVVIECKRSDVPLDERVDKQAEEYALKSGARWIWATNGDEHRVFKWQNKEWKRVVELEPLKASATRREEPKIPDDCNDKAAFKRYVKSLKDRQLQEAGEDLKQNERCFVLAMHRVLFGVEEKEKKLPYSHDGVHILEDRGSRWRNFTNASGGRYYTRYAEFIAATSGRVEAVSLAVSPNYINGKYAGLRLCAGVTKPKRSHLALELNTGEAHCPWDEKERGWEIYHDGRMSWISNSNVMEAVREAGMEKWIDVYDEDTTAKEWVYLGYLAESATWRNSKKLLANLIHYTIIRTNLREADAVRRKAKAV